MKLSVARAAADELSDGAVYYASQADAEVAEAFIQEFERCIRLLLANPLLGARWEGVWRRLPMRRFPYNIVYRVSDTELRVIALAHQRRKPGYWTPRK